MSLITISLGGSVSLQTSAGSQHDGRDLSTSHLLSTHRTLPLVQADSWVRRQGPFYIQSKLLICVS
jgi:hypothetical protein